MVRTALSPARPAGERHPVHRERRQPGLPGRLRPRRGAQGRHRVGDRRRGQAAEIFRHVRRLRPDGGDQDRPAAASRLRRRPADRQCAADQSDDRRAQAFGQERRRHGRWIALAGDGAGAAPRHGLRAEAGACAHGRARRPRHRPRRRCRRARVACACASAVWCRVSASARMSGGWRCATVSPALP